MNYIRSTTTFLGLLFSLIASNHSKGQVQLGSNIVGEAASDDSSESIGLSGDGNRVVIGAPGNDGNGTRSGHARVYEYDISSSSWLQLGLDIDGEASANGSGYAVAISDDGSRVAVGAWGNDDVGRDAGHVRVYEYDQSTTDWIQFGSDIDGENAGDWFGISVSLNEDGSKVAVGAYLNDGSGSESGHVRIYEFDEGSGWQQLGSDIDGEAAGDHSGYSISISPDGSTVAIGAPGNDGNGAASGHVRVYEYNTNSSSWIQLGSDIDGQASSDRFGSAVSLNYDGSRVAIGSPEHNSRTGHVRIFEYDDVDSWMQLGSDIDGESTEEYAGRSVSLSSSGDKVAIGAWGSDSNGLNTGQTRLYEYDKVSGWIDIDMDINGESFNDRSGWSVSLSSNGNRLAIGTPYSDINGSNSGHVRVFSIREITWTGATDNNWSLSSNWDLNEVPLPSDNVIIANSGPAPVISSSTAAELNNLTVNSGASLTLKSGGTLLINGTVNVDGTFTSERQLSNNAAGLNGVSSPVTGQTLSSLTIDYAFTYTNDGTTAGTYSSNLKDSPDTMTGGKGYFIGDGDANTSLEFTGTPNTGDITFSAAAEEGFELVGNPFNAPISYSEFIAESANPNITGSIWIWNDNNGNDGDRRLGDYIAINSLGSTSGGTGTKPVPDTYTHIPTGQAFFVEMDAAVEGTDVFFKSNFQDNASGTNSDANFFRVVQIGAIKLALSGNGLYNETVIFKATDASSGLERRYDTKKLNSDYPLSFYSYTEGERLAIQGVPEEAESVALGFDAREAGSYEISIVSVENINETVLIRDQVSGLTFDGANTLTIPFTLSEGVDNDARFELLFKNEVLSESAYPQPLYIYGAQEELLIGYASDQEEVVTIYTSSGKKVFESQVKFHQNEAMIKPPLVKNQLYVLRVNEQTTKFIVK